jgi:hypothetical protein
MADALAYLRANRNRRPVFAVSQILTQMDGVWRSHRQWTGVGTDIVAVETVMWREQLLSTEGEIPSIEERNAAAIEGRVAHTRLTSHRTGGRERSKRLSLPYPAVTPASLPLFMAQNWRALMNGERLRACYLILKMPWATPVTIGRRDAAQPGRVSIAVTPSNAILRVLFGAAVYEFDADAPRLHRIDGVLDPRDRKSLGGWREYLGSVEFETPLDLTPITRDAISSDRDGF